MSTFGSILVNTLVQGSLYALVGVGIVVLFRSTGVFNFAQGVFVVLGAYFFYWLNSTLGLPLYPAFFVDLIMMMVLGAFIYLFIFRRLVGTDTFVLVIGTLGLSVVIQTIVVLIAGAGLITPPIILSLASLGNWHGIGISPFQIFTIVSATAVIFLLELVLRRTGFGVRMRAVADNTLLAGFTGVQVHLMSAVAWAISALCAAVAGVSLTLQTSLDPIGLQSVGLVAFAGILLGGIDSITGALIGGIVLALVQQLAVNWLDGTWSDPVAYSVMLVVLLLRPRGLFGSRNIVRL